MPPKNEPAVSIVPLCRLHIGDMSDIERLCFSQPWSLRTLADELENPLAFYQVCQNADGRVLGYIGTRMICGECHITNVAVHPDHRRQGIARLLLAALESCARERGVAMMTLEVRESNGPARAFYDQAGFVPVGRRKRYYELPDEDAILMSKALSGPEGTV